ncbi:Uma2 family endonuclease [Nibrella saemangeumensis]|uniref:Uma2 family endonuclease n=1 Tax=Nibrella saemangeumensis TaxID=1084526 RepID=A0ABP8MF89_9BACT
MSEPFTLISPDAYLEMERRSLFKHEYYRGQLIVTTGAGNNHNIITGNLIGELHHYLKEKPCTLYHSDMRLFIPDGTTYAYPDLMIVSGLKYFTDEKKDTLVNPLLIIEVLSPGTEAYDRGEKFRKYRTIPSLQEYVMVSSEKVNIEVYQKIDGHWLLSDSQNPDGTVQLESIGYNLTLAAVYAQVEDFD